MKYSYHRSLTNNNISKKIRVLKKFEWKHRNIILFVASLIVAWFLLESPAIHELLEGIGSLGYLGAFLGGILFTYALTVAPGTAVIFILGDTLNPFFIAFIGAFGSVLSDYLIFRFVRDRLLGEIKLLAREVQGFTKPVTNIIFPKHLQIMTWKAISHSKTLKYVIPVIAGFIIASPLPDELGVALFGAVKFKVKNFLAISYLLNFLGILTISVLGKIL